MHQEAERLSIESTWEIVSFLLDAFKRNMVCIKNLYPTNKLHVIIGQESLDTPFVLSLCNNALKGLRIAKMKIYMF